MKRNTLGTMRVLLALLALAVVSHRSLAQIEDQISSRGFQADKVYNTKDIDAVNLFNGNLTLSIPIGDSYPISENFSYGFVLTYNSYVWDHVVWPWTPEQSFLSAVPTPVSNAGLGWTLTLGTLIPPHSLPANETSSYIYVSSDGGRHKFHEVLHASDRLPGGADPDPGFWYTRDNSYLRLHEVSATVITVEEGSGTVHTFNDFGNDDWRLVSIQDQHADTLTIDYVGNDWVVSDPHGRTHYLHFQDLNNPDLPGLQLQSIELEAFDNSTATYTFSYYLNVPIDRGCRDSIPPGTPGYAQAVTVPLLREVQMPHGESYVVPALTDYTNDCAAQSASGTLERLRLPTDGEISWEYQTYHVPGACEGGPQHPIIQIGTTGVESRSLWNPDGTLHGTWHYDNALAPAGPYQCDVPGQEDILPELTTTVLISPDGSCTESFFSAYASNPTYGLPIDHRTDWDGLSLSSQVWSEFAQAGPPTLPWEKEYTCSGALLRSEYLLYVDDNGNGGDADFNRRVRIRRTRFDDDPDGTEPRYREIEYEEFDGLGNYRNTIETRRWDNGLHNYHFTDFNPDRGVYGDSSFNMLPSSEPWLLNTYVKKTSQGGQPWWNTATEFCFGPEGRVEKVRGQVNGDTTVDEADHLTLFEYDGSGNLLREENYGGDIEPLTIGAGYTDLCDAPTPSEAPQYVIEHEYEYGVRKRSYYVKANGSPMPFNTLDLDIDQSTGLPAATRDVSEIRTDFTYDLRGRITSAKPEIGHGAETRYTYLPAGGGQPASVTVQQFPNAGGGELTRLEYDYDGFGRVAEERRTMPGGNVAHRASEYNARGWLLTQTSWGYSAPSVHKTTFGKHDPFGRPSVIEAPDGSVTSIAYKGAREVSRTALVAGNGPATTIETYDPLGQLRGVTQDAGPNGETWTTWYEHDDQGRLRTVEWEEATNPGVFRQRREWGYDNLGQLRWLDVPEQAFWNDRFDLYDARGNPALVNANTGPGPSTTLRHGRWLTYDRGERLIQIHEAVGTLAEPAPDRMLKKFVYASTNGGAGGVNKRKGKIYRSYRYNYKEGEPDIEVVRDDIFQGLGGRVSRRTLTVDGKQLRIDYTWNELGQPLTLEYPRCTGCGGSPPNRILDYEYVRGWLTGIPSHVTEITYQPNGLLASALHSNGVEDVWVPDPNDMARPYRIYSREGANILFDTGNYAFDAAGNIASMGSDVFSYDAVGRITSASMPPDTESYTYNQWGYIRTITTNGSTLSFGSGDESNRWTVQDYAGNISYIGAAGDRTYFEYDKMNNMVGTEDDYPPSPPDRRKVRYLYDADDERVARLEPEAQFDWDARGLDNRVLRTFRYSKNELGAWVWSWADYIYRGETLNSEDGEGLIHVHLDHLGSVRAKTAPDGTVVTSYHYLPYGTGGGPSEKPAFTGHERNSRDGGENHPSRALHYMHARHYMGVWGRFLQLDPVESADPRVPQSWNRFAYARNNPMTRVDPDGKEDRRSYTDVAILEDPDVLKAVAEILIRTRLDRPLQSRQEAGAVVRSLGGDDYDVEGGVVSQGYLGRVDLRLGVNSDGEVVTLSGKPIAALIHSHPGSGRVRIDGKEKILFGGRASGRDEEQAITTKSTVYILNADHNLLKLVVKNGKATTQTILTRKDYDEYLARARGQR